MKNKWKCIYYNGCGKEYIEGIFMEIKRTAKRLTLKIIEAGWFAHFPEIKIRKIPIGSGKRTKFCPAVREWADGDITVYHYAIGTPFVYKRI